MAKSGTITLNGDVIFRGKGYAKGKHKAEDLPEDFPDAAELNEKIANAGHTEGLKVSARSATAAAEADDLDEIEEGEVEEEDNGEKPEAPPAKGKTGNAAGNKGNSGKPRTKPKK